MKKKSILPITLILMLNVLVAGFSAVKAVPDYVGIKVGDKENYVAKFEYKNNETKLLKSKITFSIEVLEIQNETTLIFQGDAVPVIVKIKGTWSGDNITGTSLGSRFESITGSGYNVSFEWNYTQNIYKTPVFIGMFAISQDQWLMESLSSPQSFGYSSKYNTHQSYWNQKGWLLKDKYEQISENETTGHYERQFSLYELQSFDIVPIVVIVAVAAGVVVAVTGILYKKKKGTVKSRGKSKSAKTKTP
ncbi:MAG: hypothetical protein ACTSUE_17420 [Promethearchaeota archaeon]